MTNHRLKTDAANRTVRTFLQGLGFAVLAALVMVLLPVFTNAHGWSDFHWSLLGFSLVQAVGTAILAFVMRTVLDPSGFPTPLPPADPGQPDDVNPGEAGRIGLRFALFVAAIGAALCLATIGVHHHAATTDDARDTTWSCPTCLTHR